MVKKFLFVLFLIVNLFTIYCSAQVLSNTGGFANVISGTVVSGGGIANSSGTIINTGTLTLSSDFINGGTINGNGIYNIGGNWSNTGTFTAGTSTVTLNGILPQSIGGTSATNFYNLTLSNASGASLTSAQNLIGTLTLSSGTFTTTGQTFTLISDISGTARIATIPGGAAFVGNLTMQRYLTAGSDGWIMLGTPITNATLAQWDDDFVTGGFPGSQYPVTVTNSSILSYTESLGGVFDAGWATPTDISDPIGIGQGYSVYVLTAPFTIGVTGAISTGNVDLPVTYTDDPGQPATEDGWNVVSNPYPSTIDWDDSTNWVRTNINSVIYMYVAATDQYTSYSGGVGVNGGSRYIASSQSFVVQTNAAGPLLRVTELAKTAAGGTFIRSQQSLSDPLLKLNLTGNNYTDQTAVHFTANATTNFDNNWDARKFYSSNSVVPGLATLSDTIEMSINSLPLLTNDLNIPLLVKVGVSGTYVINVDSTTNMLGSSCLLLEDLLTHTFTDLHTTSSYSFYILDTTVFPRFIIHISKPIELQTTAPLCNGSNSGIITALGNGVGPWDYIWQDQSNTTIQTHTNINGSDTLYNTPAGNYTISVTGTGGFCNGIRTETVELTEPLAISAQANVQNTSCPNTPDGNITMLSVSGGTTPYTYNWSNGISTSDNTDILPGTYTLTITDSVGCTQLYPYTILQNATPFSSFSMNTDTVNLSNNSPVVFTNTSTGGSAYNWDFGDGSATDNSSDPVHTYQQAGTYDVSLIVSAGNCSDTIVKSIVIMPLLTTGINVHDSQESVKVGSIGNTIELLFDLESSENGSIEVYNALGQGVFKKQTTEIYKNKITFDFSDKAKGIYFIKIQIPNQTIIKKIIRG